MIIQHVGLRWKTEPAVQDHRLGMWSLRMPHRQLWIVQNNGIYADEDRIVECAELVRHNKRFAAAQPQPLPVRARYAPIQALRIAQRDKGAAGDIMLIDLGRDSLEETLSV
jgi:hypothetical protein